MHVSWPSFFRPSRPPKEIDRTRGRSAIHPLWLIVAPNRPDKKPTSKVFLNLTFHLLILCFLGSFYDIFFFELDNLFVYFQTYFIRSTNKSNTKTQERIFNIRTSDCWAYWLYLLTSINFTILIYSKCVILTHFPSWVDGIH